MKLVIDTQFCENYGAHSWDGQGECPQRWKFKGGETYVVPNITSAQQARIERDGIPTISALIETDNDYSKEYIINYRIVEDAAKAGEEWETPYELAYVDGKWIAHRFVPAEDYWTPGFVGKREQYEMLPAGAQAAYECEYVKKEAA